MKQNGELTKDDLVVDSEIQIDCDIGQEMIVYFETWFDVDRKFNIHTGMDDGTWLNMYGRFNPFEDTLMIECVISDEEDDSFFDYVPTGAEAQLMKEMIIERIQKEYNQTPKEFCESFLNGDINNEIEIGGIQ